MSPLSRMLLFITGSQAGGSLDMVSYLRNTGFLLLEPGNVVMILIGLTMIYLAIRKDYEPLLLVPIGFGILAGNMPYNPDLMPIGYLDVLQINVTRISHIKSPDDWGTYLY